MAEGGASPSTPTPFFTHRFGPGSCRRPRRPCRQSASRRCFLAEHRRPSGHRPCRVAAVSARGAALGRGSPLPWRRCGDRLCVSAYLFNQPQPMLSLAVLWGLERAARGRAVAAGVLFALAASLKIYPLLFLLVFVIRRQWPGVAAFAGRGRGSGLASIVVAGWPAHAAFLALLADLQGKVSVAINNLSLPGLSMQIAAALQGRKPVRQPVPSQLVAERLGPVGVPGGSRTGASRPGTGPVRDVVAPRMCPGGLYPGVADHAARLDALFHAGALPAARGFPAAAQIGGNRRDSVLARSGPFLQKAPRPFRDDFIVIAPETNQIRKTARAHLFCGMDRGRSRPAGRQSDLQDGSTPVKLLT